MIYNFFIISLLLSLTCFAAQDISNNNNTKSKYSQKNNTQKNIDQNTFLTKKTINLFTRVYGKNAIKRLLYIEEMILGLKNASLYEKLYTIDQLVNRIHFMTDSEHWSTKDYWATPLETIGTNYGDTEDIALLKYVLMLKVGINPRDIQLIKKEIPFERKNKKYEENISLFYFTKKYVPLVFDYEFRGGEIYKYKDRFKFTYITNSQNKVWDIIFKEDITDKDTDKLLNYIVETKTISTKE